MLELEEKLVDFGDLPPQIDALMQQAVAANRTDAARARALFHHVIEVAPTTLPAYRSLAKLLNRAGELDDAMHVALDGLAEAARQVGLEANWRTWNLIGLQEAPVASQRALLQFLKMVAFLEVRRGNADVARLLLARLQALDPADGVGHSVIASLLDDDED